MSQIDYHQTMMPFQADGNVGTHPIDGIVHEARKEFAALLARQSNTVEQATLEYTRRYGRQPPPAFREWFRLAKKNNFVLIDEFDTMMQPLEPFWGTLPSMQQTLVANTVAKFPNHFIKYEIEGHRVIVTQGDQDPWFSDAIKGWIPYELAKLLPDITLLINPFDEPNVSVPRDQLEEAVHLARSSSSGKATHESVSGYDSSRSAQFLSLGKQDAWEAMTVSCPIHSKARTPICHPLPSEEPIPFIRNITQSLDVCEHCELRDLEGFFIAPESLQITHSLIPVWSQAKPSSFNDILFPSPYYRLHRTDYIDADDAEWAHKDNKIYWTGAATGGHATDDNWRQLHRQRLALMTQPASTQEITLLHESDQGHWQPYNTSMAEISSLFSTRIIGTSPQCEPAACLAQRAAFDIGPTERKDEPSEAYKHKFVLDLDGNGFSGRYYRLLGSRSVVLKQTIFQEWHDDRLFPWIHYVPVSTGFGELPETARFLATTERGEEIAERIARESREWAGKALRDIDLQLVWFRLLMEYAHVMDPEREKY
jgi:hypothetical protein